MIGNDVIDLQQAKLENNWQRAGYLEKIFTKKELKIIEQTKNKDLIIWQFWSMKEAVYKIVSRMENRRFFAPKQFECFLLGSTFRVPPNLSKGKVSYQNYQFFSNTIFNKNHIHTVAQLENLPPVPLKGERQLKDYPDKAKLFVTPLGGQGVISHEIFDLPNSNHQIQSQTTHQQLISKYAEISNLQKSQLKIQKNKIGIPSLYYKNEKLPVEISMSHHGKFGGFAIKIA